MSKELAGLEGIQFIRSGWLEADRWGDSPDLMQYRAAELEVAETVRDHGGIILPSLTEVDDSLPWYRLDLDYDNSHDDLAHQLASHEDRIPLFRSPTLSQLAEEDITTLNEQLYNGTSFVLAYTRYARGHAKYLIENPSQLDRILRLQADFPDMNFGANCEVRPFIETPSDQ